MKSCTARRDENNAGSVGARWAARLRIPLAGTCAALIHSTRSFQSWSTVTGGSARGRSSSRCQRVPKRKSTAASPEEQEEEASGRLRLHQGLFAARWTVNKGRRINSGHTSLWFQRIWPSTAALPAVSLWAELQRATGDIAIFKFKIITQISALSV